MANSDEAIEQIRKANHILTVILVLGLLTLIGLCWYGITEVQKAATEQAQQNEELIRKLTEATDKQHREQLEFVKCITVIPRDTRTAADINRCFEIGNN